MGEVVGEAGDPVGLSFLRGVVGRRQPSQRRSRRKEREEVGRELVRHSLVWTARFGRRKGKTKMDLSDVTTRIDSRARRIPRMSCLDWMACICVCVREREKERKKICVAFWETHKSL